MKSNNKIAFIHPQFPSTNAIANDYRKILQNNWFTNFGPFERDLSNNLAKYIGHNVEVATVANATLGIMLAIQALFPEPTPKKNEVLMPSFTFAAGAEMLILLGYKPVFIDINRDTIQLDIAKAEKYLVNNKAKVVGILFCNIFGVGTSDIDAWEKLCKKSKVPCIIDSAAGLGSKYKDGSLLGWRGDCEVFSFHATKPFAVGEGGAVISRNKKAIAKIRQLQNFGFNSNREAEVLGINAKLQELNCAIGIRQLKKLDKRVDKRKRILSWYRQMLSPHGYQFQDNSENSSLAFASIIAPSKKIASKGYDRLTSAGVEARRYYNPPLHSHVFLKKKTKVAHKLVVTEEICQRVISLPIHDKITKRKAKYICEQLIFS